MRSSKRDIESHRKVKHISLLRWEAKQYYKANSRESANHKEEARKVPISRSNTMKEYSQLHSEKTQRNVTTQRTSSERGNRFDQADQGLLGHHDHQRTASDIRSYITSSDNPITKSEFIFFVKRYEVGTTSFVEGTYGKSMMWYDGTKI